MSMKSMKFKKRTIDCLINLPQIISDSSNERFPFEKSQVLPDKS